MPIYALPEISSYFVTSSQPTAGWPRTQWCTGIDCVGWKKAITTRSSQAWPDLLRPTGLLTSSALVEEDGTELMSHVMGNPHLSPLEQHMQDVLHSPYTVPLCHLLQPCVWRKLCVAAAVVCGNLAAHILSSGSLEFEGSVLGGNVEPCCLTRASLTIEGNILPLAPDIAGCSKIITQAFPSPEPHILSASFYFFPLKGEDAHSQFMCDHQT